jgi:hypothetical protein
MCEWISHVIQKSDKSRAFCLQLISSLNLANAREMYRFLVSHIFQSSSLGCELDRSPFHEGCRSQDYDLLYRLDLRVDVFIGNRWVVTK